MRFSQRTTSALQRGFTVLELFVILIAIGILLAVILSTRAGVGVKERNTERQRDVAEIRDTLESYYTQFDRYPTLDNVNSDDWRKSYARSVDSEVWRDPSSSSNTYKLVSKPAADVFAYQPTSGSGDTCDNKKIACTQYTLTATLEGGGSFVKNNLN